MVEPRRQRERHRSRSRGNTGNENSEDGPGAPRVLFSTNTLWALRQGGGHERRGGVFGVARFRLCPRRHHSRGWWMDGALIEVVKEFTSEPAIPCYERLQNGTRTADNGYDSTSRPCRNVAVHVRHPGNWSLIGEPHPGYWDNLFSCRPLALVAAGWRRAIRFQHLHHPPGWAHGFGIQRRVCMGKLRVDGNLHADPVVAGLRPVLFPHPPGNVARISGTALQPGFAVIPGVRGNCRGLIHPHWHESLRRRRSFPALLWN